MVVFVFNIVLFSAVRHVHACEWNPNAVEALRRGLTRNGVSDRCTIHPGDSRQVKICCFIHSHI